MSTDYYFCPLGRHIWPALDGRPRDIVRKWTCAECAAKRLRKAAPTPGDEFKRSRMWLGDRGDVGAEHDDLDDYQVRRDDVWAREECRKSLDLEAKAIAKAAKDGQRFVTSAEASTWWWSITPTELRLARALRALRRAAACVRRELLDGRQPGPNGG